MLGPYLALSPGADPVVDIFIADAMKRSGRAPASRTERRAHVGVVPVFGLIHNRPGFLDWVGVSTRRIAANVRALVNDPAVTAVVLDIDSGGGSVSGVTELAAELRELRREKPILAHVDASAGSAAYWIASQATSIVLTPSGMVGSIGVRFVHAETSHALKSAGIGITIMSIPEFKGEGNEFEPLGDEARGHIEAVLEVNYKAFVDDVAAGRGVSSKKVHETFGRGRMVVAKEALALGMVDRIASATVTYEDLAAGWVGKTTPLSLRAQLKIDAERADVRGDYHAAYRFRMLGHRL